MPRDLMNPLLMAEVESDELEERETQQLLNPARRDPGAVLLDRKAA